MEFFHIHIIISSIITTLIQTFPKLSVKIAQKRLLYEMTYHYAGNKFNEMVIEK